MSDLYGRVTEDQNIFQKLLAKLPGFKGYFERSNRRQADKLLRTTVADRFEEQWQRISSLQRDLISQGEIGYIDDVEAASLKLRQFIDRVRTASYGYAGFFAPVKIDAAELERIYSYDLALLDLVDEVSRAIENVEASMGTDGLPAAFRNLTSVSQKCVETFNQRRELIKGSTAEENPQS